MITSPRWEPLREDSPTAWPLFLNVDDDVGFLQLFLQPLILATQLFVITGQWITLRLRPPLLRESLMHRGITFFPPAVQR